MEVYIAKMKLEEAKGVKDIRVLEYGGKKLRLMLARWSHDGVGSKRRQNHTSMK